MESNPALGLLGFWMFLQLVATLILVLGGIYVLFCLGRAASGLDRMANAMEEWVERQNAQAQAPPPAYPPQAPLPATPPAAPVPVTNPVYPPAEPILTDESKREL